MMGLLEIREEERKLGKHKEICKNVMNAMKQDEKRNIHKGGNNIARQVDWVQRRRQYLRRRVNKGRREIDNCHSILMGQKRQKALTSFSRRENIQSGPVNLRAFREISVKHQREQTAPGRAFYFIALECIGSLRQSKSQYVLRSQK